MTGSVTFAAQAFLFDMDGVLVSSIGSATRCWRLWAKHHAVPGWETFDVPHGRRARDIMRVLIPDITEEQTVVGLRLIEDMEIADVGDLMVLPGVRALLEPLPLERWAIVTSATVRLLEGRLRAAKLPIPDRLITAESVSIGKPHPEPYQRGARLLGFQPSECVVVEDAPAGVGSGKAAGSPVLGVLGTHTAEELYAAGADWVVTSLEGVVAETSRAGLSLHFTAL